MGSLNPGGRSLRRSAPFSCLRLPGSAGSGVRSALRSNADHCAWRAFGAPLSPSLFHSRPTCSASARARFLNGSLDTPFRFRPVWRSRLVTSSGTLRFSAFGSAGGCQEALGHCSPSRLTSSPFPFCLRARALRVCAICSRIGLRCLVSVCFGPPASPRPPLGPFAVCYFSRPSGRAPCLPWRLLGPLRSLSDPLGAPRASEPR